MYVQAFECKAFSTVYWTDEKVSVYYVALVKLQGPSQRWEYLQEFTMFTYIVQGSS